MHTYERKDKKIGREEGGMMPRGSSQKTNEKKKTNEGTEGEHEAHTNMNARQKMEGEKEE
jgi:hypothetical protein